MKRPRRDKPVGCLDAFIRYSAWVVDRLYMVAGGAAAMVVVVPSSMLPCAPIIYLTLFVTVCLGVDYVPVAPIDTALTLSAPPFERSTHHPQPPKNVSARLDTRPARLQTNSFYSNWLVSLE